MAEQTEQKYLADVVIHDIRRVPVSEWEQEREDALETLRRYVHVVEDRVEKGHPDDLYVRIEVEAEDGWEAHLMVEESVAELNWEAHAVRVRDGLDEEEEA